MSVSLVLRAFMALCWLSLLAAQDGAAVGSTDLGASGGEIAFARDGQIILLDVLTRSERVLVEENGYDRPLCWLPDGSRLVYWNHAGGAWDLWAVAPATGERHNLTRTARDSRSLAARPDGQVFAFHRGGDGVWLMRPDGSQQTRLHERGHRDLAPVWSPGGARLAFAWLEQTGERSVATRAMLVELGGADGDRAVEGSAGEGAPDEGETGEGAPGLAPATVDRAKSRSLGPGEPMFFLDDRRVVLQAYVGEHAELVVLDLQSGQRRALTSGPQHDLRAVLSPDGARIAWIAASDEVDRLMVMRADGAQPRVLAELDEWYAGPSFSPDGRSLTFESGETRRATGVWIVAVDGGQPQRVVPPVAKYPVWRPRP